MQEEDAGDGLTEESQPVEPKEVEPEGQEEKEFDADEDEGRKKGEPRPRTHSCMHNYSASLRTQKEGQQVFECSYFLL